MKIIEIQKETRSLVEDFIKIAGKSLNSFTYFEKRGIDILDNHEVTLIGVEEGFPAAYGHLDRDSEAVWLGIAVSENQTGKGLGKKMMLALIECAKKLNIPNIKLSVYKENKVAWKMYEKFEFKREFENSESYFYNLKIQ